MEQTQLKGYKGKKDIFFQYFWFNQLKILTLQLEHGCSDDSSAVQHFTESCTGLGEVQLKSWPWWSQSFTLTYDRLPPVTLRNCLTTVYLHFPREHKASLFDRGVMRTNSWCLGTTSCDADNRHREVCGGHWTHSILMTLESKRAHKSNITG